MMVLSKFKIEENQDIFLNPSLKRHIIHLTSPSRSPYRILNTS